MIFRLNNDDFLMTNDDFLVKNDDFLTKHDDYAGAPSQSYGKCGVNNEH